MTSKSLPACLVLHGKTAARDDVRAAVGPLREAGLAIDVRITWELEIEADEALQINLDGEPIADRRFRSTWLKLGGLLATALVGLPVVVLAVLSYYFRKPVNVGLVDGWLADCPDKPNCVCSQAMEASHRVAPIDFSDAPDTAWQRMKSIVSAMRNTKIVSEHDGYLHAECHSRIFRFVDDLELLLDAERKVIHCRSASRVGHYDFGANRRRIEGLRRAFADQLHALGGTGPRLQRVRHRH